MAAPPKGFPGLESTEKANSSRRRNQTRQEPRSRRSAQNDQWQRRCSPPIQKQRQTTSTPMTSLSSLPTRSRSAPNEHVHPAQGITMERTPSGNSIMSDTPISYEPQYENTLSDEQAARRVESHFRRLTRPRSNQQHERILRNLIKRDGSFDDGEVDDDALQSILIAADSLFFGGELAGRVMWEWSSHDRYQAETIGSTALRCCTDRPGIETLIVLSHPILRSQIYDRRLLLSAFLHELVHCYLFIMCGFDARNQGGHTDGFERIVTLIDAWIGKGYLRLCSFKADLDHFVKDRYKQPKTMPQQQTYYQNFNTCTSYPQPEPDPRGYNQYLQAETMILDASASRRSGYFWS